MPEIRLKNYIPKTVLSADNHDVISSFTCQFAWITEGAVCKYDGNIKKDLREI
jgi:hypothetical protein